jgi:prolyl-tRNA synthetase
MRYSQLFGKTKLTAPHDAESVNARLLTQAGFVDKLAAGIYNFLPLGLRVLQKVNAIIRDEMNKVGGQEILMPSLQPVEIWNTTGRNKTWGDTLYRTKGAGGKDFVFGPSHEETVTPLAAKFVQSHKDLPFAVYQIQTKFRNEARAKSGILRGREFGMKDMYSFHKDDADLDAYYEVVKQAYTNVYKRCGMTSYVVEASGGAFTNNLSHEFSIVTPAGEDTIIICKNCDIAQNLEIAEGKVRDPEQKEEKELPMKEVQITRGASVVANAQAHNVPEWKILKTVVYKVDDGFLGVAIRGDLQINENKLTRYLGKMVRAASPAELTELGLVQGFISPVGEPRVKGGLLHAAEVHAGSSEIPLPFIADHSIRNVKNFVTGANKKDVDLVNVNIGRDFEISDFTDLVAVEKGFKCPKCGNELHEEKAIEAGNIFKLGTRYSKDCELYFTDVDGKRKLVIMGCYGIGNTRLVGTIAEASHDDKGLIWPKAVAPYHVHLLSIGFDKAAKKEAESLYKKLVKAGVEVLFDDRDESAGKKFNDADIIGIPLRVVVSERTLKEGAAEFKLRAEKDGYHVPIKDAAKAIKEFVNL